MGGTAKDGNGTSVHPSASDTGSNMPGKSGSGSSSSGSASGTESGSSAGTRSQSGGASGTGGGSSGSADANGGAGGGTAQTPDERRGAIDRRLDETLGTFDKEIRKEQEKNAADRDARNAANAAGAGSGDTESSDSKKDGDAAGTAGTEGPNKGDRKSRAGDLKSDKDRNGNGSGDGGSGNAGGKDQGAPGSTGNPIPDGSDDDVVARRLRKAAEAETDPELKEKLWKEYVEYKKNSK